ncbi:hypothetical protein RGU72_15295 [Undibacterium sp. 5I1]|uniref:hypothetical protein n=1 Tax=unclassified Undibacterium TaxID=2630295 RepID=UPI002AB4DFB7|nr:MULTISPECIES: hypothetical protein [unclassified Undibacterium]MDY7539617.1 hypothetical protein [Undibacterium sp. 5I1]MEB0230433.1 hypothetical protein [Undibacterium sp. 10I3]MEB0258505.1 hypothetical protein [Undibacterium sp. 5I1]
MLRTTLLFIGSLMTITGLVFISAGNTHAWPLTLWGTILLAALLLEKWRYRPTATITDLDKGEWQKTDEEFIDPESGALTQVFYQAATGERRYVQVNAAEG